MEDIAGNELFKQIVGLAITEFVERAPDFLAVLRLGNPHRPGFGARLKHPRCGNTIHVLAQLIVILDANEWRNEDARIVRRFAHNQLVAEVANGGDACTG